MSEEGFRFECKEFNTYKHPILLVDMAGSPVVKLLVVIQEYTVLQNSPSHILDIKRYDLCDPEVAPKGIARRLLTSPGHAAQASYRKKREAPGVSI